MKRRWLAVLLVLSMLFSMMGISFAESAVEGEGLSPAAENLLEAETTIEPDETETELSFEASPDEEKAVENAEDIPQEEEKDGTPADGVSGAAPTAEPTVEPTLEPTAEPTAVPTVEPAPTVNVQETTEPEKPAVRGICGDELEWSLDGEGVLMILGSGEMIDYSEESAAPWAEYAAEIRKVVAEQNVTSIGDYAFCGDYANFKELVLPDTLTRIGEKAFSGCAVLENVVLPHGLTEIGANAFEGCGGLKLAMFAGTAEEYAALTIGEDNEALTRAMNGEEAPEEEKLTLSESAIALNVGEAAELHADAAENVEWSSSDEAVAVVQDGTVTALSEGTAVITAKAGEQEVACTAVVTLAVEPKLAALTFRGGTDSAKAEFALTPAFDPEVRDYTIMVPDSLNPVSEIAAWATLAEGAGSRITVNYVNLINNKSVQRSVTSGAEVGMTLMGCVKVNTLTANVLTIQIDGQDAYTVRIVKQPTLSALSLAAGEQNFALNEALDKWTREYSAVVPYGAALTVNAETTVEGVTVLVNGAAETSFEPEWSGRDAALTLTLCAEGAADGVYTIRLRQAPSALEIVTSPAKTEYEVGETFDPAGLELRAIYGDGTGDAVPAEEVTFEPAGALTKDVQAITLKYAGLTAELPIRVGGGLRGSGTAEDPWQIESAADFETVRELVSKGMSFGGEFLVMTKDVSLPADWSPIGESMDKPFSGALNGQNHTLTVAEGGLPLLGCVRDAKVSNLNIYGKKIAGYGLVNDLQGVGYAGTAIAIDHVTLKSGSSTLKAGLIGTTPTVNIYAGCSKDFAVSISNCTVESGVVIGYNKDQSMIGSIAGRVNGTISNCTSAATVYGTDYVGGILGTRDNALGLCRVSGSRFTGSVVASGEQAGGIVGGGYSDSSAPNGIKICVNDCTASGSVSGRDKVGGILGADIFVAQAWDPYSFTDNSFTGTVHADGSSVGGVIGYYRSLNKWDDITGNYYSSACGAKGGFGFVEYVDTSCVSHETQSGALYFNTETSVADCPGVTGCAWKKAHNRTDDPLGADAAKLMRTDGTEIVEVTGISLSQSELEMKVGDTVTLIAVVTPENATDNTVRWSSSDESVASVQSGVVTAKAFGTATITATAGSFSAECSVKIVAEPAENITVSLTVSNRGMLAKAGDGSAMFDRDVEVRDVNSDGVLTYDEALMAAHEAYCPGGYVSEVNTWGVSVSKLWGVETMNCLFYLNDSALTTDVGSREGAALREGDWLTASVNLDDRYYADHYVTFSKRASTATAGETFTLKLNGSMGSEKISIGTWSDGTFTALEGAKVDADGNVTLIFAEPGTYLLTASGTIRDMVQDWSAGGASVEADCPIIAPGCRVRVAAASTDPEAKPVKLTLSGDYKKQYAVGDRISLKNMVLTVSYSDGSTKEIAADDAMISGFDTSTRGEKTVTVSYGGLSASFVIVVTKAAGTIDVTLTVLGDSKHGDGKVHTLAKGGLTTWVKATTYNIQSGATVWEVLKQSLEEHNMSWSNASGNYVAAVNGLAEFDNGKNSGWMYTLNGKYPLLGVSEQKLKDGDRIVFHYTDDYTLENTGFAPPEDNKDDEKSMMVQAVEKLIVNIGTVTLEDGCKARIDAARKAYDKLSYAEKKQVENYAELQSAEKTYAELKQKEDQTRADEVMRLIDEMGRDKTKVADARKAYDQLTAEQKKLVTNYARLTAAEYERASSVATKSDWSAADDAIARIDAIGTKVSEASREQIEAAHAACDALSDTQRALVSNYALLEAAEGALERLNDLTDFEDLYLATGDYLQALGAPSVGSIGGEWMALGLARSGREVDELYFERALEYVAENIDTNERLNPNKATENARLILALTALGRDAADVDGYNLIAGLDEMSFVQKQGINGPVWTLIALDSNGYEPSAEGDVTREALITAILDAQLPDGGWAFAGENADTDMTAMALQAVAPYYDENADADNELNAAIERGVDCLSMLQFPDGGFGTYGSDGEMTATSESVSQVIVALTALNIDPDRDERFVKNGASALDALVKYGVEGGGLRHLPDGERDGMATEQGYYALTAYARSLMKLNRLYDMTDAFDENAEKIEPRALYIGIEAQQ